MNKQVSWISPRRCATLVVFLSFLPNLCEASVKSPKASTTQLDLSYKHNMKADRLAKTIRSTVELCDSETSDHVEVDVSSCGLTAEGIREVVVSLFPEDDVDSFTTVDLLARMNHLTPEAVDEVFNVILGGRDHIPQGDDEETSEKGARYSQRIIRSLDLGWNELHPNSIGWKDFLKSLQRLIESPQLCPQILRLDCCGLAPGACRAIGKGLMNRFKEVCSDTERVLPLKLHLSANPNLGDAGTVALAAAIRTIVTSNSDGRIVLDSLNLSGCGVGDAGAEALALAIESCDGITIKHLNLSNNKITDDGASALGYALLEAGGDDGVPVLESLELSNNKGITDQSAQKLAAAFERGKVKSLALRSCGIQSDGAACFGKAMAKLAGLESRSRSVLHFDLDLSGNALGVLRKKSDKGSKYSASALKSKASATTAAYMSLIGKKIRSGLKDVGVEISPVLGGSGGESDDDEEVLAGMTGELVVSKNGLDASKARCGVKAFSRAFLSDEEFELEPPETTRVKCSLAMRRCFMDHGAADSLAAVVVHAKEELGMEILVDTTLNPVLEEEMLNALRGVSNSEDILQEMASRHLEAQEAIELAQKRALEASQSAAARVGSVPKERENLWDPPDGLGDMYDDMAYSMDDSDAHYDPPSTE